MTAPAPLRRTFVGPQGIRAGWRLLLFVVLAQGVIGLPLQWFVVRVLGLGVGGEWTAAGFMLAETVGGLGIVPTFAAAWLMSRMERRPFGAYGLPWRGAFGRQFWAGWGWGLGGVAALAALIAALGGLRVAGWALSGAALARAAVLWAIAMTLIGLAEEFAFRGYPQFTLASGIGFWRAAALLSLVFGGLHYFLKPMENLADFASVGLIGLFLCLTLRRTGSLWFAVGFHAAFDFAALFVFSAPNTGNEGKSLEGHLLNVSFRGPDWLTGGPRGIEASALVFVVIAALFLLFHRLHPAARYPRQQSPGSAV